jgi:hypothetical protein
MEKVTQTTAAGAEESASASEELNAQSGTLHALVRRLTRLVGGGSNTYGGPARRSSLGLEKPAAEPVAVATACDGPPPEQGFQEF